VESCENADTSVPSARMALRDVCHNPDRRARLALHTAVVVQPLSVQQVTAHLTCLGKPLAALSHALKKNATLQELATTPLMLQVLMLTYHSTSVRELSHKEGQLRQQIWTDSVQRMVSRKGDTRRYPFHVTTTWLSFLARQMRAHQQTIFFLEHLQPDWLPQRQRRLYQWSVGLLGGLERKHTTAALLFAREEEGRQ
jgi:hypothetical protein